MEPGESSNAAEKPLEEIWAKLVPLDSKYSDIEIRSNEMVICSEVSSSSLDKHEWCKITRSPDLSSTTLQNMSSNAIIVDGTVLGSEDTIIIKCGTEIVAGSNGEGYLSYMLELMSASEQCSKQLKVLVDVEHTKCSICLNIWHDVVTVAPCLHNFCNGCFSEWLRRSQKKSPTIICPLCRAVVHFVGRNHFLRNIEEGILDTDPSLKRGDDEFALLDGYALIKSNLIIGTGKRSSRKRPHPSQEEEITDVELPCPQCGTEFGGFRCNQNTAHLQCQTCGGLMPSRTDVNAPQHCLGCDRVFCGAYWQAQGLVPSSSHLICSSHNFKPIAEHTITGIPLLTHENNRHEQDITERCIRQSGKTLQEVISEFIIKLNDREVDRTRLPLNHAEMITSGTHICNGCYEKLVSFLLYWFRVTTRHYLLPPDASKREDCWYGFSCRTQHHNDDHALKRNHICRPTRGRQ
ncbi:hypothetical protein GIB67_026249 [Kingdonia uniflora]|uniref:RING-type domain-containing protein n=1 Tax=Kingdonia uniflora TaxID=39325 RepID=A0A7J7L9T2_9MAGN|nr:hypothetical protein GIB67_026249 [Kingdonia uniflora]